MNQRFSNPVEEDDVNFFYNELEGIDLTKDQFRRLAYFKIEQLSGLADSWAACALIYQDLE